MHPLAYLLPPLVFLIPTFCFGATRAAAPADSLYALNTLSFMPRAGYEFGRFFDAAARRPATMMAAPLPVAAPAIEETPREALARPSFPFVLDIPKVPPMPFERAFRRIVLKKDSETYDGLISRHAAAAGLDPRLVKSVIAAESEFSSSAVSPAGARGLMQVMPATSGWLGIPGARLFDPEENIRAGVLYLQYLFGRAWKKYHLRGVPFAKAPGWLVQRVIAAYNAGPRFLAHRRLYRETRDYVRKVLLFYRSKVTELAPK